jgi:hypothetical protein
VEQDLTLKGRREQFEELLHVLLEVRHLLDMQKVALYFLLDHLWQFN